MAALQCPVLWQHRIPDAHCRALWGICGHSIRRVSLRMGPVWFQDFLPGNVRATCAPSRNAWSFLVGRRGSGVYEQTTQMYLGRPGSESLTWTVGRLYVSLERLQWNVSSSLTTPWPPYGAHKWFLRYATEGRLSMAGLFLFDNSPLLLKVTCEPDALADSGLRLSKVWDESEERANVLGTLSLPSAG